MLDWSYIVSYRNEKSLVNKITAELMTFVTEIGDRCEKSLPFPKQELGLDELKGEFPPLLT